MRRRRAWLVVAVVVAVALIGAAAWLLWPGEDAATGAREAHGAAETVSGAEATELAQKQLDEHLTECTRPAPEPPPSCGIRIPWQADFTAVDEIRYRIEQTPTVMLAPPSFRADDGILVATVSGTGMDGAAETMTYRTENWMLRGDVSIKGDEVVLSPW